MSTKDTVRNREKSKMAAKVTAVTCATLLAMAFGAVPAGANTIGGYKSCTSIIRVSSNSVWLSGQFSMIHRVTGTGGYSIEYGTAGFHASLNGSNVGNWKAETVSSTIGTISNASATCSGIS